MHILNILLNSCPQQGVVKRLGPIIRQLQLAVPQEVFFVPPSCLGAYIASVTILAVIYITLYIYLTTMAQLATVLLALDATTRQETIRTMDKETITALLASGNAKVIKDVADILGIVESEKLLKEMATETAPGVAVTNNAVTTTTTRESVEEAQGAKIKSEKHNRESGSEIVNRAKVR